MLLPSMKSPKNWYTASYHLTTYHTNLFHLNMKFTHHLVLALIGIIPAALADANPKAAQAVKKRASIETRQDAYCGIDCK